MKVSRKIIAVFCCIAIISSFLVLPVYALGEPDITEDGYACFFEWAGGFTPGGLFGSGFSADRTEAEEAYNTYVSDLPASTLDDAGYLYYKLPISYGLIEASSSSLDRYYYFGDTSHSSNISSWYNVSSSSFYDPGSFALHTVDSSTHAGQMRLGYTFTYTVPIDCYVFRPTNLDVSYSVVWNDGSLHHSQTSASYESSSSYVAAGTSCTYTCYSSSGQIGYFLSASVSAAPAYLKIKPYTGLVDVVNNTTYNINSRPTSITGDYGIIGDDGTITKVDGNVIVDESSSTVYNPVTNTTTNFTNWSYDYSDRSYNLTTEAGDTITVTYGDENITINEGDTIYNVYYVIPQEQPSDPGTDPGSDHTHTYTDEITKQPTCLLSGVRTYTCSCGDSYTKTVPATGHDWQISQQVPNTYDPETGEQTQAGYTVYTCATCGEQYKSTDGTAPPNSSAADDSSGGIGGVLSGLLGAVGDVIAGLIEGALTLATKAMEALTGLGDLVSQMIETVLGFFGGFIDFMAAMFPFLPEETFTILNLGLILMIAAAVFRKFLN